MLFTSFKLPVAINCGSILSNCAIYIYKKKKNCLIVTKMYFDSILKNAVCTFN